MPSLPGVPPRASVAQETRPSKLRSAPSTPSKKSPLNDKTQPKTYTGSSEPAYDLPALQNGPRSRPTATSPSVYLTSLSSAATHEQNPKRDSISNRAPLHRLLNPNPVRSNLPNPKPVVSNLPNRPQQSANPQLRPQRPGGSKPVVNNLPNRPQQSANPQLRPQRPGGSKRRSRSQTPRPSSTDSQQCRQTGRRRGSRERSYSPNADTVSDESQHQERPHSPERANSCPQRHPSSSYSSEKTRQPVFSPTAYPGPIYPQPGTLPTTMGAYPAASWNRGPTGPGRQGSEKKIFDPQKREKMPTTMGANPAASRDWGPTGPGRQGSEKKTSDPKERERMNPMGQKKGHFSDDRGQSESYTSRDPVELAIQDCKDVLASIKEKIPPGPSITSSEKLDLRKELERVRTLITSLEGSIKKSELIELRSEIQSIDSTIDKKEVIHGC